MPEGKREKGENDEETLKRELLEELGEKGILALKKVGFPIEYEK